MKISQNTVLSPKVIERSPRDFKKDKRKIILNDGCFLERRMRSWSNGWEGGRREGNFLHFIQALPFIYVSIFFKLNALG